MSNRSRSPIPTASKEDLQKTKVDRVSLNHKSVKSNTQQFFALSRSLWSLNTIGPHSTRSLHQLVSSITFSIKNDQYTTY